MICLSPSGLGLLCVEFQTTSISGLSTSYVVSLGRELSNTNVGHGWREGYLGCERYWVGWEKHTCYCLAECWGGVGCKRSVVFIAEAEVKQLADVFEGSPFSEGEYNCSTHCSADSVRIWKEHNRAFSVSN